MTSKKTLKYYLFDGGIKDKEFIHFFSTPEKYFTYKVHKIENFGDKIFLYPDYQKIKCKLDLSNHLLHLERHLNDEEFE